MWIFYDAGFSHETIPRRDEMDFVIILYHEKKKKEKGNNCRFNFTRKKNPFLNDFSFVSIYKKYRSTHVCKEYFL